MIPPSMRFGQVDRPDLKARFGSLPSRTQEPSRIRLKIGVRKNRWTDNPR